MKKFAVIGLGTFGSEVAKELISLGNEVTCIDKDEEKVIEMSAYASHAAVLDATDEKALLEAGILDVSHVIVALGGYDQTMVLTTLILKGLGIKNIIVKVKDPKQEKIMQLLGVEVIFPEGLMAQKLAQKISAINIVDIIKLSDEFSYVEFKVPNSFIGKNLDELDFRKKYNLNVVAVKRQGKVGLANPYENFKEEDVMIMVGFNGHIEKFDKLISEKKL